MYARTGSAPIIKLAAFNQLLRLHYRGEAQPGQRNLEPRSRGLTNGTTPEQPEVVLMESGSALLRKCNSRPNGHKMEERSEEERLSAYSNTNT